MLVADVADSSSVTSVANLLLSTKFYKFAHEIFVPILNVPLRLPLLPGAFEIASFFSKAVLSL